MLIFSKCLFSADGNSMSLEKMFSFDASSIGVTEIETGINVNGDKVLMFSRNRVIVYSLHTQSVIARKNLEEMNQNFQWSHDFSKGEILVNFARGHKKINVFTINYQDKTLNSLTTFSYSSFIPHQRYCKHYQVLSGTSLIVLAIRDVYLIDPFTGHLVQKITPDFVSSDFLVRNVTLNWCSNEIVVFYNENKNQFHGQVFKLKTNHPESLLHSALKVTLLNYSINDLLQMNLPTLIKDRFFK